MSNFDVAERVVSRFAAKLTGGGMHAETLAEAMIVVGLALLRAAEGDNAAARVLTGLLAHMEAANG